jgi:parvulin-like peptidyl-prolyl isomerase
VSPTDAEIQVQIDATATAAGGVAKLQSQLAALGGSMAQLRDQVASSLTEQKLEDAFAHQRAREIAQKLAAGTAFAGLAAQYSDDKDSSAKGGELGALARTTIQSGDPVFAAAVLALKPGQRTDPPIHDAQGYDIVQLESATASALTLRHIIVYAPTPYTVKERPQWFSAAIFETLATECASNQIHIYISDVGGDPCAAASSSATPAPATPTPTP